MKDSFADHLKNVLPGIFKMANFSGSKMNTYETQEKVTALKMLTVFVEQCGPGFAPYIEVTSELVIPMLEHNNDNIRKLAAEMLPHLVTSSMCEKFILYLCKAIFVTYETDVKTS